MANYQKLQVSTALNIVPSDDANIPYPNVVETGVATSTVTNQLVDSAAEFEKLNVQTGDVVYNTSTDYTATVNQVIDDSTLVLNANLVTSGDSYIIYRDNGKESCVLYIGVGGNLRVLTGSGQDVTFQNILGGTFLPVQVLKVFETGTTGVSGIVALW